ncbi:general secretion pathway protein GspA, partial [Stenotrophomonas sp. HMWF022]
AQLEARLEQQEAALRRVLTLLVDWSEIDNRGEDRREAGATIRPGAWGHAA